MSQLTTVKREYLVAIVTQFKFAAIKVRSFEIMTYSLPFNFAVSHQNYFAVSYTHVVFSYTNKNKNTVLKIIKF